MDIYDYFNNFKLRGIVPDSQWQNVIYNNTNCLVLKNPIYCNLFWLDFWLNYLGEKFKKQTVIFELPKQNLTEQVIITETGFLISHQYSLNSIDYFSRKTQYKEPFLSIPINITTIFFIYILLLLIIVFPTITIFKNYAYFT